MQHLKDAIARMPERVINELTRAAAIEVAYKLDPDPRHPWKVEALKTGAIRFCKDTHVNRHLITVIVKPMTIRSRALRRATMKPAAASEHRR